MLGPGLTTGASDDDPSGIATYSQTGAQYGFHFLWLAIFTYPLMSIVQEMCARIGLVTGRGLAGNIRNYFPRRLLHISTILLFAANSFNIGADLGAMAKGAQLLRPSLDFTWLVVGFAALSLLLQIFTPYARYARYLKWLALVLLAYIFSAILANLDWATVARAAVIPRMSFDKDQILRYLRYHYIALSFLLADFTRNRNSDQRGQDLNCFSPRLDQERDTPHAR
jgi:Mn2+/Fe2+ NRAMP family transporter